MQTIPNSTTPNAGALLFHPGRLQVGKDAAVSPLGEVDMMDWGPPPAIATGAGDTAVITSGKKLYRMAPNGALEKLAEEKGHKLSPPALGPDGTAYYLTEPGDLVARAADGSERWRTHLRDTIPYVDQARVGVSADGETIWAAHYQDGTEQRMHGLDAGGHARWTLDAGQERMVGVGRGNQVYLSHHDTLRAVDPTRWLFKEIWRDEHAGAARMTADGQTMAIDEGGHVKALDPNGEVRWTHQEAGMHRVLAAPDGSVFGISRDENKAVHLSAEGTETARYATAEGMIYDSAVGRDGTLYLRQGQTLITMDPQGHQTEVPFPFQDVSGLFVSGEGVIYTGSRIQNSGISPVGDVSPNQVYACRVYPADQMLAQVQEAVATPVAGQIGAPAEGWVMVGSVKVPVRGDFVPMKIQARVGGAERHHGF